MNENVITSKKINLSKKIKLAWAVIAVVLVLVFVFSFIKYSGYKKAQEAAVTFTLISTSKFNSYNDNYYKMVEEMYDFFNPGYQIYYFNGIKLDNSDVVDTARDADEALAKLMNEAGYDCRYGSKYLEYVGFVDYTTNETLIPWIVLGFLVIVMLFANLWYAADAKKAMIIDVDRIICKNGKKRAKEFLVKDIKSVEFASKNGLLVRGNGIKYKINLLENAEELKSTIMDSIAALPTENIVATTEIKQEIQPNSADELKKYKELLEIGVISQEEFAAKKKQLLGL